MKKNLIIFFLLFVSASLLFLLFNTRTPVPKDPAAQHEKTATNSKENNTIEYFAPTLTESLDLSGQNLEKLPSSVLSKTNLEELDISDNKLSGALPSEIRQLKNLKVLNVSNNDMTGVPAEIGQLSKLEVLNLSNNRLTGLPYELGNLKNLKVLDLSGNNYSQQDLEIIRRELPTEIEIVL